MTADPNLVTQGILSLIVVVLVTPVAVAGFVFWRYLRWQSNRVAEGIAKRDRQRYDHEQYIAACVTEARRTGDAGWLVHNDLLTVEWTYETPQERVWDTSRMMALGYRPLHEPWVFEDGTVAMTWAFDQTPRPI